MTPGLVIFDLDGTLIDSLRDLADATNAVLESLGLPVHPLDSYRQFVGDGIEMLVRRALPPDEVERAGIPDIVSDLRREYSARWLATTRPFPGIPDLLAQLRLREIHTAVLSNKPDFATRTIVHGLFGDECFDLIRGALENVPLKPDPTAALAIISEFRITAGSSLIVGDTSIDMNTGQRAGIATVGVTWGFRGRHELLAAGADHVVDDPLQLLDILER